MAEDNGGVSASEKDIIAQFQTTRVRSALGYNVASYKRIFQLATDRAISLDPGNFQITNTFPYGSISRLAPDDKDDTQFTLEIDGNQYVYKTTFRGQLLCQFFECISKRHRNKFGASKTYNCQRLRKNGSRVDNTLSIATYGIIESDVNGKVLREYHYQNIRTVGSDEQSRGLFFEASGRIKVFFTGDLAGVTGAIRMSLKQVGLTQNIKFISGQNINETISYRNRLYQECGLAISVFDVNKVTQRSMRPMPRQLHVTEDFILEKDLSGFQYVSFQKITSIYRYDIRY